MARLFRAMTTIQNELLELAVPFVCLGGHNGPEFPGPDWVIKSMQAHCDRRQDRLAVLRGIAVERRAHMVERAAGGGAVAGHHRVVGAIVGEALERG